MVGVVVQSPVLPADTVLYNVTPTSSCTQPIPSFAKWKYIVMARLIIYVNRAMTNRIIRKALYLGPQRFFSGGNFTPSQPQKLNFPSTIQYLYCVSSIVFRYSIHVTLVYIKKQSIPGVNVENPLT